MATPKKKAPVGSKAAKSSADDGAKDNKRGAKAAAEEVKEPPKEIRKQIDPDLLAMIKNELLKKKNELGANVTSELDDMREAAEGHHLADMDDLGGDAHDEETQYKIMEIESAELDQIDAALERISTGSFGYCEVCEKPIAHDRLRALPFANLCIACKRQQEVNEE
ncbi:TraR/DksA family transcriptional regulator [bacterium]|nr:TraR/DksA family transcriptional regulator [bacterium]